MGKRQQRRQTEEQDGRAGLYVRVSLDKRKHTSGGRAMADEIVSPETQEDRARSYCASQGWDVVITESDLDESGYRQHYSKRKGLMRLLDAVKRGEINKVVVFKFNRLSRRAREFLEICDLVETAGGGGIVSVTEQVDTSTPAGRLIRNIMASFAQYQSEELSEQIWETWLTKAKSGKRPPGKPPYGTIYAKGMLEPDPETHRHLLAMYETYAATRSIAAVHDYLTERRIPSANPAKEWTLTTIRKILTNSAYVGQITFDGEVYDGQWAPIVPVELWTQVQTVIQGRKSAALDRVDAHLLRGHVLCTCCNRPMWTQHSTRWIDGRRGSDRYYWCADPKTLRDGCTMPALHAGELEEAVWTVLVALSHNGQDDLIRAVEQRPTRNDGAHQRAELEQRRQKLESLTRQLFTLLHDGEITREQFRLQNRDYAEQLAEIQTGLAGLERSVPQRLTAGDIRTIVRSIQTATTTGEKRAVLAALEVRIAVTWQAVHLDMLGDRVRLPGRLLGERWYFGAEYHQLDYQGTMFTDKQIRFIQRTYTWADKQEIARRLGRTYMGLKRMANRLREKGLLAPATGRGARNAQ
jgi:site-specific DNA recombinase